MNIASLWWTEPVCDELSDFVMNWASLWWTEPVSHELSRLVMNSASLSGTERVCGRMIEFLGTALRPQREQNPVERRGIGKTEASQSLAKAIWNWPRPPAHVSLATSRMKIIVLLFFLQFGLTLEGMKPLRDEWKYLAGKFFAGHPLLIGGWNGKSGGRKKWKLTFVGF